MTGWNYTGWWLLGHLISFAILNSLIESNADGLMVVIIVLTIIWSFVLSGKRLDHLGRTNMWALLVLIPFGWIVIAGMSPVVKNGPK